MPEFKNKEEYEKWKSSKLNQLQKEAELKSIWVCPECMSLNINSNTKCKCGYMAEEEMFSFFNGNISASELYKAVLNEFDIFNNSRAIFLSHYLIKRFPETDEANRLKQRMDSKSEKVVCGKCGTENIYNPEYYQKDKCDNCGEFLHQYLESNIQTRKCPICSNDISKNAKFCPKCGEPFVATRQRLWSPGVAALLSLIIPGAGQIYKGQVGAGVSFFISVGFFWFGGWAVGSNEATGPVMMLIGFILYIVCIVNAKKGDPTKEGG